jgi:hypothetical protein
MFVAPIPCQHAIMVVTTAQQCMQTTHLGRRNVLVPVSIISGAGAVICTVIVVARCSSRL